MAIELNELEKIIRDIKAIAFQMSLTTESRARRLEGADLKMGDLSEKLTEIESLFNDLKHDQLHPESEAKKHYHVAIISMIDKEFDALNKVFNFKTPQNLIKLDNGLRVWKSTVKQKINDGKELTLLFAKIGNAGNLFSLAVTDQLLRNFEIDLLILCGIAAGNELKTSIYSVVIGQDIIYYEKQKLKSDKQKPTAESEIQYRFEPISTSSYLRNEIEEIESEDWKETFLSLLKGNGISIKKAEMEGQTWIDIAWKKNLEMQKGGILSGEKLFADGKTFNKLCKTNQIGKDIFAGEMEGYGFAFACKQNDKTNWFIVRGISDFGGDEKSTPLNEQFQKVAAYSAAALVYYYLENVCSPPIIK